MCNVGKGLEMTSSVSGTIPWKNCKFFEFMNNVDTTGKIKFTMSVANESVLEFLDLSLHIYEHKKICVDVFAKPTNSFTYVLPSTCYPKKNINNVPKGIALRLRRICDTDEKFDIAAANIRTTLSQETTNQL